MASKDDQEISVLNKRIKTLEDKLNADANVQMNPASKCQNQAIHTAKCINARPQ